MFKVKFSSSFVAPANLWIIWGSVRFRGQHFAFYRALESAEIKDRQKVTMIKGELRMELCIQAVRNMFCRLLH